MRNATAADAVFFAFFGYLFLGLVGALGWEVLSPPEDGSAADRLVASYRAAGVRFGAAFAEQTQQRPPQALARHGSTEPVFDF